MLHGFHHDALAEIHGAASVAIKLNMQRRQDTLAGEPHSPPTQKGVAPASHHHVVPTLQHKSHRATIPVYAQVSDQL